MSLPQKEMGQASLSCLAGLVRGRRYAFVSGRTEPAGRDEAAAAAGIGRALALCHMNLALVQGLVTGVGSDRLNPVPDPEPEHCCVAIPAGTS